MTGAEVKQYIKDNGVYLWQVADGLKMHDTNFSKKLRHEISDTEFERIKGIVESIKTA